MRFPLTLSFKKVALAPQIYVRDADGALRLYVKQKLMKLKEAVNVFGDEAQTQLLYTINADRILDVKARYTIRDAAGVEVGALQGMGLRSLWKTHYRIERNGALAFEIREDNAWVKVLDGLLGEVPVLGIFTGYFFNPKYNITRADGTMALRLIKQPAFLEGKFTIEQHAELSAEEEGTAVLGLMMMVLLERRRG